MFEIRGKHGSSPYEVIDTAETKSEARYLAAEYRMAYGLEWSINIKKIDE